MSSIFLKSGHFITKLLFLITCCFGLYLFRQEVPSVMQKAIYILAPFAVLFSIYQNGGKHSLLSLYSFLKPWTPWIGSILLFILAHGTSGLSNYYHVILIFCLLFLGLSSFKLSRCKVALILSLNVLILSVASIVTILQDGLQPFIYGVNRNLLIPELAAISTVILFIFITNDQLLKSPRLKFLLLSSVLSNIAVVVLSEVRTAVLVYLVCLPVLLFINRDLFRKVFPILFLAATVLICMFFLTGRIQEGIVDLLQYQEGHTNTSWGIRLELWKQGCSAFWQHPIFGWGVLPMTKTIEAGFPLPSNFVSQHYHNDLVNLAVTGGVVSLFGWLISNLYLILSSKNDLTRVMLIVAFFAIGLTESSWSSSYSACFALMVCWILLYLSEPTDSSTK